MVLPTLCLVVMSVRGSYGHFITLGLEELQSKVKLYLSGSGETPLHSSVSQLQLFLPFCVSQSLTGHTSTHGGSEFTFYSIYMDRKNRGVLACEPLHLKNLQ